MSQTLLVSLGLLNLFELTSTKKISSYILKMQESLKVKALNFPEGGLELAVSFWDHGGAFGSGDWCTVFSAFVWTFNGPHAVLLSHPYRGLKETWHPQHLQDIPNIFHSTFSPTLSTLHFPQKQLLWIFHGEHCLSFTASSEESGTRWWLTGPLVVASALR